MKGKVTCTCGWSWNKSDSSKKDMYICHECGRDNSNNISKAQNGVSSKDVPTPLIPYSNEYTDSLENNYLNLYNNPSTRMDDGYDAFFHSMVDGLPDVTRKAKGWVEYKPGTDIEEFTEDDGTNSAPIPGKNKMVKRVEDYEISDRPDVSEQVRLAHYMQERAINKLDSRTVSNKGYGIDIPKQKNGGWLESIPQAQVGKKVKKVKKETEVDRAKRVAQEAAKATGVGIALNQVPGLETIYDAYNVIDGYRQGDPMKIFSNMMGALVPGTSGKAFEAVTDEYLPKIPQKEKDKMKAVLNGKRASIEEMRKAQESVNWSKGWETLKNDVMSILPRRYENGGWLDQCANGGTMQEHQENYNDSYVALPKGFVGMGNNIKGRNYSPAWGGQFQMGGSIPGSVGFTYARTKGIPSEGPYAKKTMPSAQNGQEMRYYQNGLDWKPKSISRNGGWLDGYEKAQEGYTTGNKVEYGTPEYREAYNKGEVVTDEGVRSPIALDEVVIQNNYKRPRGFWEQYRDKIVEENKDAGVLGAIIGTPISAITSLPQLAATYAITDKMQRPSEAMDVENPYGAFIIDAVADPTNLIGAGILTKENAFSKLSNIKTSIAPELRQGLQTNGISDLYKINPWATKIDDAATKIVGEGKNSFIYDPAKPMYHRTYKATPNFLTGYKQIKKPNQLDFSPIINARTEEFKNKALQNFKTLTGGKGDDIDLEQFVDYFKKEQERLLTKFEYQNFLSNINREKYYDTPEWKNVWDDSRDQAEDIFGKIEETLQQKSSPLGKRLGSGAEGSVYELADDPNKVIKIGNTFKTSSADDLVKSFEGITDDNIARVLRAHQDNRHLIEIMPNLNANAKFSNFTKEQVLDKLEKDAKVLMDRGFQLDVDNINGNFRYNPDKNKVDIYDISKPAAGQTSQNPEGVLRILRDHFNNAYIIPGTHSSYDPNMPTPEFKQGGIIKDDRGQWDHPGEVTEINSPYITMQGVPYPVLGISDTGDTKLMKPGKDYKFKGKKVTEFPMAKNGLRQEQKGLVNLDQLTNWTNYNTKQKGGWLDNL